MQVRQVLNENPDLLPILNFYEGKYNMGNFLGGKYITQRGQIELLHHEIAELKKIITEKDKEIERLFNAEPRK